MDNLAAEKAVIGALLIKPMLIDDIVEILDASDFQAIEHGLLYSSIQEIGSDKLDIITLSQHLSKNGLLDNIGGMTALSDIYTNTPSAANAIPYARIVKDSAQIRRLMYKANELVIKLREVTDYKDAQVQVNSILDSVEVETEGYKPFKDIVKGLMLDLDARMKSGGGFKGLKTGFNQLDDMLMGLNAGDYFVIGARPSMGKTAFSLALCQNIAKEYGDVLYFSAESTKESLCNRVITSMGNVDSKSMKTATLSSEKWTSLMANMQSIMNLPVHIIDHSGIDISHARAIAKKFNRKKKINAIFVDYVQLMTCKKSSGDFEVVSNISRGLKAMAKENDCPVIALAQLSRGVEQRPDKRPNMSDLRATGQIEQDADFATFLYRDEYYNEGSADKGITEFLIKKNRDGETGKVFFKSDFSTMRYEEINYTHQPKEESYKPFARN